MLSFKQYLAESSVAGNYVCAYTDKPPIPETLLPKSGIIVPPGKCHITLIYSEFSDVDQRLVNNVLSMLPQNLDLTVTSAEVFDSKDEEGNITDKGTLVLKVKNKFVDQLHDSLISLGMMHSYPEYAQHVTIAYKVGADEAREKASEINTFLSTLPHNMILQTYSYESKDIDKNYADKLK